MAFKMRGAPFQKKDKEGLLPSEHKDTKITGGNKSEKIIDLEDRIGFIEEDISNADGKMTPTQRADLAKLEQKLRKLKKVLEELSIVQKFSLMKALFFLWGKKSVKQYLYF